MKTIVSFIIALINIICSVYAQEVLHPITKDEIITVRMDGIGRSKEEAVNDAIEKAIFLLLGGELVSNSNRTATETSKAESSNATGLKTVESGESFEQFKKDIKTSVKGKIKGYREISSKMNHEQKHEVVLDVDVYQPKRNAVAVFDFKPPKDISIRLDNRSILLDQANLVTYLKNSLYEHLVKSKQFKVIDEESIKSTSMIQNFSNSMSESHFREICKDLKIDFYVSGQIEFISREKYLDFDENTNVFTPVEIFSSKYSFKLIDAVNGQIKLKGEKSVQIQNVKGASYSDGIHSALAETGKLISKDMADFLSKEQQSPTLNQPNTFR